MENICDATNCETEGRYSDVKEKMSKKLFFLGVGMGRLKLYPRSAGRLKLPPPFRGPWFITDFQTDIVCEFVAIVRV